MTRIVNQLMGKAEPIREDRGDQVNVVSTCLWDKWLALSYIASVLGIFFWITMASKTFSPFILLFISILIFSFVFSGNAILNLLKIKELKSTFTISFVIGFIYLNSFAYIIYVFTNMNVLYSYIIAIISIIVIKYLYIKNCKDSKQFCLKKTNSEDSLICLVSVLLIILGVTLWSQQSINPIIINDSNVIYKPWTDSFIHARFISQISASNGLRDLQSMALSGEDVKFYHYAYYFLSAFVKKVINIDAYSIYCGLLVPFGLFLTCISAFAFIENLFDSFAASISCFLIVILPSASQMGLSNQWFNYHWLLQISPGLSYGISVVTLAWLFMIIGCKNRYYSLILLGWFIAAMSINYKAHIFVANALLIFMYPTLFFQKISIKKRLVASFCFLSLFTIILMISWSIESLPLLKIDGSAFKDYSALIVSQFEAPIIKNIFSFKINSGISQLDTFFNISYMSFMVFINTFGIIGVLYLIFIKSKKINFTYRILPLLFIINYIIMALGLTRNNRQTLYEEFMHRPFVWAYFIVTIFVGGYFSIYLKPFVKYMNRSEIRFVIILLPFFLLVIPLFLGSNIIRGPLWGNSFINTKIDRGLYDVANYIKKNSNTHDIIQYSRDDKLSYLISISERQTFVNMNMFIKNITVECKRRLAIVKSILNSKSKEQFNDMLTKNNIKWFVFHKDDSKKIPDDLVSSSVCKSSGYLLFKNN